MPSRRPAAPLASRGRLLGPVTAWDLRTRVAFAEACADRVRGLAPAVPEGPTLLGAVERMGAAGRAGPAGYWASVIAGQAVAGRRSGPEYDNGFARERDAQANWLRDKLGPGT